MEKRLELKNKYKPFLLSLSFFQEKFQLQPPALAQCNQSQIQQFLALASVRPGIFNNALPSDQRQLIGRAAF